ncbi:MAG: DNA topoisomerase 1 [Phycisphaeraceae bacterium]|nr:MAG: DNA topoisomerase 1 [Phycisphaeraceae bacterium]
MAKRTTKKTAKKTTKKAGKKTASRSGGRSKQTYKAGDAVGKSLVIVESPSKAKTINKYLGDDYVVLASIGHVRDLPSKNPKGVKAPVPGVDLEKRFQPSYEVLKGKEQVMKDLKRAAKDAISSGGTVWFATDLDREGEAIAWHLAQELGIASKDAKRVIFPAITKTEIAKAFNNPHEIDEDRVNAQQARRILDRIVGYQVSPLLWKKVARGLSAGRVQSVAVRLIVDREREIDAFVPDESWNVSGYFSLTEAEASKLGPQWRKFLGERDEKGNGPTIKAQNGWLGTNKAIRAELVEFDGGKFDVSVKADEGEKDVTPSIVKIAEACGLHDLDVTATENPDGKGPAKWTRTVSGIADASTPYKITAIETKRTKSRPTPPFITSTLQQGASSRLGFGAQRTMRAAQSLYEGVNVPGEGPTGLITYMRTDATYVSPEAIEQARSHVQRTYGDKYLPEKPNLYKSSNKDAQEAHEAIRPTDASRTPDSIKSSLKPDEFRLYKLIWERFVASQMVPAEWDSTAVTITGGANNAATFRATGRILAFDGHFRVSGVPTSGDELNLPKLDEGQTLHPLDIRPTQRFSSPPARYTEAGLIKVLEAEGIGRPSTYAAIIQTIQDRKYVEQIARAFWATDLGEVVTDKLVEAFPEILDIGYTRDMEAQLDQVEEEHLDWVDMLAKFYGPFTERLERAHEELTHAKAEIRPAPKEYRCAKCDADLVYRFGKNGRFLSCSRYPDCDWACPCDRAGRPQAAEFVDVTCPKTGRPMIRKTGRFGPFLTTILEDGETNDAGMILNIDKKGFVTAPSLPPLETDLPCPTCESPLNLRSGVRGPWLGCSRFPKCRGRGKWTELDEKAQKKLEDQLEALEKANPVPIITRLDGTPLTDTKGKPLPNAPKADELTLDGDPRKSPDTMPAGSAA